MRNGIIFSAVVHVAAILIAVLGLPLMQKPIEIQDTIPIEIVDAGELAGPQVDKTPPAPPRPPQQKPAPDPGPSRRSRWPRPNRRSRSRFRRARPSRRRCRTAASPA